MKVFFTYQTSEYCNVDIIQIHSHLKLGLFQFVLGVKNVLQINFQSVHCFDFIAAKD